MPRILGISGSLRDGSHNTALLRAAAGLLPPGVDLDVYDGLRGLPSFDADPHKRTITCRQLLSLSSGLPASTAVRTSVNRISGASRIWNPRRRSSSGRLRSPVPSTGQAPIHNSCSSPDPASERGLERA